MFAFEGQFSLSVWNVRVDKPYFDEKKDIQLYKLQQKGYTGFCFCSYSAYELKLLREFKKKHDAIIFNDDPIVEGHHEIGKYNDKGVIVMTKNMEEFQDFVDKIPARNKKSIVDKKKRLKYKNYKYVVGTEGIILTHNDPQNQITHKEYTNLLKVMNKLTA